VKTGDGRDQNARKGRSGKGIFQHRKHPDRFQDTVARHQIDGIGNRTQQAQHVPRQGIRSQVVTLLCQDTEDGPAESEGDAGNLQDADFLFEEEEY